MADVTQPTPGSRPDGKTREVVTHAESAGVSWLSGRLSGRPRATALATLISDLVVKQSSYRLSLTAAGSAFWLSLALFPAAISAVLIFGLIANPTQVSAQLQRLASDSPGSVRYLLAQQLEQIVKTESGTFTLGLVVSLVLTLWSASAGAYALLRAIRLAYGLPPLGYVRARTQGVIATFISVVGLGLVSFIVAATSGLWSDLRRLLGPLSLVLGAVLTLVIATMVIAVIVRYAVYQPTRWRSIVPAAGFSAVAAAVILIGVVSLGSTLFDYQAIYGALSTVAASVLALYMITYVFLLAVLFNALWQPLPPAPEPASHLEQDVINRLHTISDGPAVKVDSDRTPG